MKPKSITDGKGCCFTREDEMPAGGYILYASELGSRGEREEVDATKDAWGKVEEENGGCESGGHNRWNCWKDLSKWCDIKNDPTCEERPASGGLGLTAILKGVMVLSGLAFSIDLSRI